MTKKQKDILVKEVAETKVSTTKMYARESGYPLHAEAEPE